MPELPDLELYVTHLNRRIAGARLERVRVAGWNLVRTTEPALAEAAGRVVVDVRRVGKRLVFGLEGGLFLALHLMISGRLHWKPAGAPIPKRTGLAAFDFAPGTLLLTEASTKQRAALHLLRDAAALAALDAGGIEPLSMSAEALAETLAREDHTLKRALTDPRLFAGIGNAYSDEILHAAQLSPVQLTGKLGDADMARLYGATRETLDVWTDTLRREFGDRFPGAGEITAFRPGFAVHGRYGQDCPTCGTPVQRIRYADNETNYCPTCQTGGRLLADRSLSRLLKSDWPKTLEEMEMRKKS